MVAWGQGLPTDPSVRNGPRGNNTDGKTRLEQLKEHAQKAKEKGERTNVDLRLCKEGESSKSGKKSSGRGTGGTGSSKGDGSNIPMS